MRAQVTGALSLKPQSACRRLNPAFASHPACCQHHRTVCPPHAACPSQSVLEVKLKKRRVGQCEDPGDYALSLFLPIV